MAHSDGWCLDKPTLYKVNIYGTLRAASFAWVKPSHPCSAWSSIRESQSRKGRQRRAIFMKLGGWKTKAESRDSWLSNLGAVSSSIRFSKVGHLHSFPLPPATLFLKSPFFNLNLFLAGLGLHCCARAFSSCGRRGLLCSCGSWASHCSGFSFCRAPAVGNVGFSTFISGSVVSAPGC